MNEYQETFEKMKKYLLMDLVLAHNDPEKEVIVVADLSENGIGAVLLHKLKDGPMKPIALSSRILLAVKKKNIAR